MEAEKEKVAGKHGPSSGFWRNIMTGSISANHGFVKEKGKVQSMSQLCY